MCTILSVGLVYHLGTQLLVEFFKERLAYEKISGIEDLQ
jgi:hypothetical protein